MDLESMQGRIRCTPIMKRLEMCSEIVGKMCAEGRPPKMSIPVSWEDEDIFLTTTIEDARRFLSEVLL